MRIAIFMAASFLCLGAQANNYIKKCGADYGKFIKGTTRVVTATTTVENRLGASALTSMQRRALALYNGGTIPVEVQSSVYLNASDRVAGHRVRVMKPGVDNTKIYFYFSTAKKLLRTFTKKGKVGSWVCEGYQTLNEELILDLADELGEYISPEDMPAFVTTVSTSKLPKKAQTLLAELVQQRADDNCPQGAQPGECNNGAMDSEEHYIIMNEGKVIGFIFSIWDSIDHPLWDGSGVHHFIKASNLEVLTSTNWEG